MYYLALYLLTIISSVNAIIGYDCGGHLMNITTISLLGVDDCDLNVKVANSTDVYVQLLQLSNYNYAEVIQCKVEVSKTIHYCGMHSHISAVRNGRSEYLHETTHLTCLRMFTDGVLSMGAANIIEGLKPNQTVYRSLTLAGTVNNDGTCKGTQYSDPYGTWNDVIVQAVVRISLKSSYVPVNLNNGKIILKSGTTCSLSEGFCIDSDDGYTYWKPMPTSSCNFQQYDVLYEGTARKIQDDSDNSKSPVVYSLVTQDITFALTKTTEQPLCGYTLLRTEHPKLFILETQRGNTFASRGTIPVNNLDIFAYVNSKFVYVEKHIRSQMTSLYHNVLQQRCELEKQVLKNTLSFATLLPDDFAYRLMKGPGYMAVVAGEVVHIVKCIPVELMARPVEKCYNEFPVSFVNSSWFITPKSRILTKFGTERECNNLLPMMYRIEDTWIQLLPKTIEALPPQNLKPMTKLTWKYITPGPLAVSGIYSEQEIEKLRDHIMFAAEKPALLHSVARGMSGHPTSDGASFYNLFDQDTLDRIAKDTASKVWEGFITFGSASAGIFGIFIIIRLIKVIIDTTIHGYALHSVYGCSLHLIGAIWSSVTHLLIYLAHPPEKRGRKTRKKEGEGAEQSQDRLASTSLLTSTGKLINTPIVKEPQPSHSDKPREHVILSYRDLRDHINFEQIPPT